MPYRVGDGPGSMFLIYIGIGIVGIIIALAAIYFLWLK
jgi:hypothetical protein